MGIHVNGHFNLGTNENNLYEILEAKRSEVNGVEWTIYTHKKLTVFFLIILLFLFIDSRNIGRSQFDQINICVQHTILEMKKLRVF